MKEIEVSESLFHGHVSLQHMDQGFKPWRVPYEQAAFFVPQGLNGTAEISNGVRLCLVSDTTAIEVHFEPNSKRRVVDCVIDNTLVGRAVLAADEHVIRFENLSPQTKRMDLYLPHTGPALVKRMFVDEGASVTAFEDDRPRWITYGSSITQSGSATGPSETWPALVTRNLDVNLTCLGYGGNCHLEPMVARMIRDMPADFITMCVGINIMGQSSLSERTFASSIIGFIQLIRERHPSTPLAVISPIYCEYRETEPNKVGLTLVKMREEIEAVVRLFQNQGDSNIYYWNGLDIFGEAYASYMPDRLHPNAEGNKLLAERIAPFVRSLF